MGGELVDHLLPVASGKDQRESRARVDVENLVIFAHKPVADAKYLLGAVVGRKCDASEGFRDNTSLKVRYGMVHETVPAPHIDTGGGARFGEIHTHVLVSALFALGEPLA